MSEDIVDIFDSLPPENAPRHLPVGGTVYKFLWADNSHRDDWKANGWRNRWRKQGAARVEGICRRGNSENFSREYKLSVNWKPTVP